MSDWKRTTLGSVCSKIGSGATPRGGKESYKTSGISLIRSQNVLDYSFSTEGLAYIGEDQAAQLDNVSVQTNDVLINITGDSVARVCLAPEDFLPARVNQHVAIIRAIPTKADAGFLLYTLQYQKQRLLSLASAGATRNALTKQMLEVLDIAMPPIDEQRAISETLSALNRKIANNMAINHRLEQMAQAIFKSWFVDFEPFGGVIPEDWREGILADICAYCTERIAICNLSPQTYISTENMLANKGGFIEAASLPRIQATTAFQKGDVLISNIRPYFKKIVYCDFSGGCSTDVLCFRPKKPLLSLLVLETLYADQFFDYMVAGSKGTKMPRGDKQQILQYRVAIPTEDILIDFNNILKPIIQQLMVNVAGNHRLANIRDTLLPRLMSGELSVANI
jgi:type I restriction enzyme S subunit